MLYCLDSCPWLTDAYIVQDLVCQIDFSILSYKYTIRFVLGKNMLVFTVLWNFLECFSNQFWPTWAHWLWLFQQDKETINQKTILLAQVRCCFWYYGTKAPCWVLSHRSWRFQGLTLPYNELHSYCLHTYQNRSRYFHDTKMWRGGIAGIHQSVHTAFPYPFW